MTRRLVDLLRGDGWDLTPLAGVTTALIWLKIQ